MRGAAGFPPAAAAWLSVCEAPHTRTCLSAHLNRMPAFGKSGNSRMWLRTRWSLVSVFAAIAAALQTPPRDSSVTTGPSSSTTLVLRARETLAPPVVRSLSALLLSRRSVVLNFLLVIYLLSTYPSSLVQRWGNVIKKYIIKSNGNIKAHTYILYTVYDWTYIFPGVGARFYENVWMSRD